MRQIAAWLLILSTLLAGCSGGARPGGPEPGGAGTKPTHGIARAEAEALVGIFLQDKVEGDFESAIQRILPKQRHRNWARAPEWTQWQIVNATEVEEGWLIETREYRTHSPTPSSSIAKGYYLIVRQDGKLFVDMPELRWADKSSQYAHVATIVQPDVKNPERRLVLTEGGMMTALAEIEPALPKSFRPYGAPPDILFGVGDNGWGALALSPDLQQVAFATRGTHAFLGIADRAGTVKGLDLWFEGGAGELAWSFDGQYLAATVVRPSGIFGLQLWKPATGEQVKITGVPKDRDVSRLQWQNGTLRFRVGAERWVLNPATGEGTRPGQ